MKTNYSIITISQLTGFYLKCNSRLNGLKTIRLKLFPCNTCCILNLPSFKKEQSVAGVLAPTRIISSFNGNFLCSHISEVLKKDTTSKTSKTYEFCLIKLTTKYFIISFCKYSPQCFRQCCISD